MVSLNRNIVVEDFYGYGEHIYEDQLGFDEAIRKDAQSNVSHDIFVDYIGRRHYELGFYHIPTGTFYFITPMEHPMEVRILPRDERVSRFIGFQCDCDAAELGTVIATYETAEDLWNHFSIDGEHMEEIILQSYITVFT